jgi:benzoate-CoA ligase family protein
MPELFNAATYLLDRHVEQGRGDRAAVSGPAGTATYAELLASVEKFGAGLRQLGVRPEERVVMAASDSPQLLAAILAVMRIGAVAVPVNTMLTGHELGELLRDARARVAFCSAVFAAAVAQAAAAAPELREVVLAPAGSGDHDAAADGDETAAAFPPAIGVTSLAEVLARGSRYAEPPRGDTRTSGSSISGSRYAEPPRGADPPGSPRTSGSRISGSRYEMSSPYPTWADSPALWLYTSGTTGTAKGAVHRHANIRYVAETYPREVLGITPDDRCYSVAKLFFAYGLGNSAFFPLAVGGTAILDPARPTPALVAQRLASYRPTLFFAVPSFYAALLAADVPADALRSVRLAVSAGETLPAGIYQRFLDRFRVPILDGIGSTEALHIFVSNRPGSVRPGSSGTPVTGYEVDIRDENGRPVADGFPGDLYLKAPSAALGYWCRTDITRKVFQGEWMRTGDVYVRSADGYYTCLGRSSDMIKAGGIWVSPAEVEARLLEHPGVAQAAVVGLADADGLETPVACVVRTARKQRETGPSEAGPEAEPDDAAQAAELVTFCRAGLAAFKRPRAVLFFESLPSTATGKLRRFAVRKMAAEMLAGGGLLGGEPTGGQPGAVQRGTQRV